MEHVISSEQYVEALSTDCVHANSVKMFTHKIYKFIVKVVYIYNNLNGFSISQCISCLVPSKVLFYGNLVKFCRYIYLIMIRRGTTRDNVGLYIKVKECCVDVAI